VASSIDHRLWPRRCLPRQSCAEAGEPPSDIVTTVDWSHVCQSADRRKPCRGGPDGLVPRRAGGYGLDQFFDQDTGFADALNGGLIKLQIVKPSVMTGFFQ
jgi:hypothetical protein